MFQHIHRMQMAMDMPRGSSSGAEWWLGDEVAVQAAEGPSHDAQLLHWNVNDEIHLP